MEITFLNKAEKERWLPRLFALLYENMNEVAPSGVPYEVERDQFLADVAPALEKAPRQVLMALEDGDLLGYIQYYTREDLLMVEEVQIRKDHQGTLLFLRLCRQLLSALPEEIRVVEAYADRRNHRSRQLMNRLGMVELPEPGEYLHFRGDAKLLRKRFLNR